jgi:radical SAM superfamily enzyme YgiQ (UPF0313 family)
LKKVFDAVILTDANSQHLRIKPLGAWAIANVLRERGYSVLVIDFFSEIPHDDLLNILQEVIGNNTLFVGYSSTLFSENSNIHKNSLGNTNQFAATTLVQYLPPVGMENFYKINSFIKSINSNIKLVYGGTSGKHFLRHVTSAKNNYLIDYVFHGYSEYMICDFVDRLKSNRRQQISNKISGISIIDYDIQGSQYDFRHARHSWTDTDIIQTGEGLPLEVARGCVFKCKFCAYPLTGKSIKDDSYIRLEENILGEIQNNYERWGTTNYLIIDDTFNERSDKIEMMARIRDRSKIDLTFSGYIRLDLVAKKPEQLDLLHDMNFRGMIFGIESLNYPSAKIIGKGLKPHEIRQTLENIKERFNSNVLLSSGFIVGLPKETPDTIYKWSSEIMQDDYPLNSMIFFPLYLADNSHGASEFFKNPEKYNYQRVKNKSYSWENEHWNFEKCFSIAQEINTRTNLLAKKRFSPFAISGLSRFNLPSDLLFNSRPEDINNTYNIELLHKNFVDSYINKLKLAIN